MTSSTRNIACGVPQGSVLGHLLFIIYMKDLPLFVEDAEITMFADNTSLRLALNTVNHHQNELILAFTEVRQWPKINKLSLNSVKTEFMILGTS